MTTKKAFTLLELVIAVIVIAILAGVALPLYNRSIERSMDQEAKNNLGLIKSAQLIYYSEYRIFYGLQNYDGGSNANESQLNTRLRISLPTVVPLAWDYFIFMADATTFTALAFRGSGGFNRAYIITHNTEAICSGNCP